MSSAVKIEASELVGDQSTRNDETESTDISSVMVKTEPSSQRDESQNEDDNNDSNNNMYDDEEDDDTPNNTNANNNTVVENTNNDNATSTSNNSHNDNSNDDGDNNNNNNNQNDNENENDNEKTNLIVNYLPQQMTDEEFEELFKKFGPMKSCKIVRNRSTGLSYGFGFVDFETNDQALKAINELNGHELETKKIKVAFARPAGQNIKQANLYIKNVPNNWTQEDVRKVFEPYGNIIQVRVLGNNRGVAFVLYDLRKQAEDALEALNGKQVDGCESPFEIKFAADKKSSDKGGNKDSSSSDNRRRDRGGNNHNHRGSRTRNNGRDHNNRTGSMDRRKQTDGRGRGGGGGRGNNQYNNQNNQPQYNNNNNAVGPVRQQSNRMARYAPFVPVQAQPAAQATMMPMAMAAGYGYHPQAGQQPMMPYMPTFQPMMQMNPAAGQMAPMAQMNPRDAYQAPMPMTGYPPIASAGLAPQQQVVGTTSTTAAISGTLYGGAQSMQPQQQQSQTGVQSMNSMRSINSHHQHQSNSVNSSDGVTLFVYNIGPDSDESDLRTMFAPYGSITKCNVVRKTPGGETKGFGFVTMQTRDQANAAISSLNGSMRNNRVLQVSFKK